LKKKQFGRKFPKTFNDEKKQKTLDEIN